MFLIYNCFVLYTVSPHFTDSGFRFIGQIKLSRKRRSLVFQPVTAICLFQSTPSFRGRPIALWVWQQQSYFNPLPLAEGDAFATSFISLQDSFQSTPSCRGRLLFHQSISSSQIVFQSTPSCRGRPMNSQIVLFENHFNPLLLQRETVIISSDYDLFTFQSTPSCRGRPLFYVVFVFLFHFNPLLLAEGDAILEYETERIDISIHSFLQRETAKMTINFQYQAINLIHYPYFPNSPIEITTNY